MSSNKTHFPHSSTPTSLPSDSHAPDTPKNIITSQRSNGDLQNRFNRKRLTEPFNDIAELANESSVTNPLLAEDHQNASSEHRPSRPTSAKSHRTSGTRTAPSSRPVSRKSEHTRANSTLKSQIDANDTAQQQAPPFQMSFDEVERAQQQQRHSTVISLNRDFFPIQNVLMVVWIVYLAMYAADPLLNFDCFFGSKQKSDTIYASMNKIYGLTNELVVDILIYVDSGIQGLLAISLLLVLCAKLVRWIGFMSGKGYFLKDFFLRAWVEVALVCALMFYFSIMSLLSNLLVGQRSWMFEMAQYFFSVVFAIMFFFPLGHPVIYYYVPVHWCLYLFSLAIDAVPYLGMVDEDKTFSEYMSALCFQDGFGVGAYYTLKAFYLIFSLLFLLVSMLLFSSILLQRSWYRSIVRESVLLVYKGTIIFHVILIIFDSLYGERTNVWMHQGTIVMLLLSSLMYYREPEICETWSYEKSLGTRNKVLDMSALFSHVKRAVDKGDDESERSYDDESSDAFTVHKEEMIKQPESNVTTLDDSRSIKVEPAHGIKVAPAHESSVVSQPETSVLVDAESGDESS